MHASMVHLRIILQNYRNLRTRTVRLTQASLCYYCTAQLKDLRLTELSLLYLSDQAVSGLTVK